MNRIESSGTGITRWLLAALLVITAPTVLLAKGPGGGKGGKVSVEQADPPEAFQGEELDVVITGSGFDEGSTATWYVTGTDDGTQVEVLGSEYLPATGQLKAHIKVHGNASVNDYDIEVMNSGGRRGKGTTLFKVQSSESACTGLETREPEIAYLTALTTDGDYETQDLYLSSASGCDQYLLLEDAAVKVPGDVYNSQHEPGSYLVRMQNLRMDVQGDQGVVIWRDREAEIDKLYALLFAISPSGTVTADASGPVVVFDAPTGAEVQPADVRFNSDNQLELLVLEGHRSDGKITERRLVYTNVATMESAILMAGQCPVQDDSANCYTPSPFRPWWNEDGSQAFVNLNSTDVGTAIARLSRIEGVWQPAQMLMTQESQVTIIGLRSDGLLAYEWLNYVSRRNGRTNFKETKWFVGSIDPEVCDSVECVPTDGDLMAIDEAKRARNWTRNGSLLFTELGPGTQLYIREFVNPFTGEIGKLEIHDVGDEVGTTF